MSKLSEQASFEVGRPRPTGALTWIGGGTLALLGLAGVGLAGLHAIGPEVDSLTIDDRDPSGLVLVVRGDGLDRLRGMWTEHWLAELDEAGVHVALDELPADAAELLRLPIDLEPGFDGPALPAPALLGEPEAIPLRYVFGLRVVYLDYTDQRETAGAEHLFRELLEHLPSDERITFEPEITFDVRVASAHDGVARSEWFEQLHTADLLTSGAYLYIRLDQAARRDPTWLARLPPDRADEPLSVAACSVRASDQYTYASAIVTPVDGALDRALQARRTRLAGHEVGFFSPADVLRVLDDLPEHQSLQWFVPSKSSTSGYLMPCLDWRKVLDDPRTTLHPDTGEHDNNLAAAAAAATSTPDGGWVVASIYETLLFSDEVERERWRLVWVQGGIPHGGVYLSNAVVPRKRELLAAGLHALIDDYRETGRPFPDFGWGISGLRRCPPNFDEFERRIFASENVDYCAPELGGE